MIFGLKCDNDKQRDDQVKDLVGVLSVNSGQIKRIVKLVAKNSDQTQLPPVLVEFDSPSTRQTARKSTGALKTHERFVGVQVTPDRSPSESLGLKLEHNACVVLNSKLPAEGPFEWRSRSGEKTKIDKIIKRIYRATIRAEPSPNHIGAQLLFFTNFYQSDYPPFLSNTITRAYN
ncbi:hypothetical protein BpHYR1_022822 [Brachionus plicatilis]|uniref:Uncharacterized protein n=1 Tax=Brachionus plicatilis TaxID=10195 RepID=A0A3M7QPC8_BRAPC|nr:hypothetical protein BpHYR1_022822 [Brachionus plicatilis]